MNIERRGKYPGVKIHLDDVETKYVLGTLFGSFSDTDRAGRAFKVVARMAKLIDKAALEDPHLLDPRTEKEIKEELIKERDKAIEKLAKMEAGKAWNEGKEKP